MRTKALVLAAAVVAGSVLTSAAQTVYSINAVGYVNLAIPQGFSMVANPLDTGAANLNTVSNLFLNAPGFTSFYKWNGTSFDDVSLLFGNWLGSAPGMTLAPGEGVFINAPGGFTNTFVGEVKVSPNTSTDMTNSFPAGFSIRSSLVPQDGTAGDLGLTTNIPPFSTVYKYDNASGGYKGFSYLFGNWLNDLGTPEVPSFKVGESFWINAASAGEWRRVFTVNP
jgi:hypothetical protein